MSIILKFDFFISKKRSLHRLLFYLVALIFFFSLFSQAKETDNLNFLKSKETVFQEIESKQLFLKKNWHYLLQLSNNNIQIKDKNFYLSTPFLSAEDEMYATVNKLYNSQDVSILCQYPARYLWLNKYLNFFSDDFNQCSDLKEFLKKAPLEKLSVIFASENLTQPSSMMGHVFLKIEGLNHKQISTEHAISFFTDIRDFNIPKLIIESLVTGKNGYYTLSPYEQNRDYYLFEEQRNIWEYEVSISEEQKKLIHYYLYELKKIQFTYYFQKYNCATLIQNILYLLTDKQKQQTELWDSPLDVVRFIHQHKLVSQTKLIPSSKWKIKALIQNSKIPQKTLETLKKQVLSESIEDKAPLYLEKLSQDDRVKAIEMAIAYNDYLYQIREKDSISWSHKLDELKGIKKYFSQETYLDFSNYKNPANTIKDSQVSFGHKHSLGKRLFLFGFLPASHTLMDDHSEYQNETELKMGELTLSYNEDSKETSLESIILYSVVSYQPTDILTQGLSGKLELGYKPETTGMLDEKKSFFMTAGLGKTYRLHKDIDGFITGKFTFRDRSDPYFLAGPEIGFLIRELWKMKSYFLFQELYSLTHDSIRSFEFQQAIHFKDHSFELKFWQHLKINDSVNNISNQSGSLLSYKYLF